MVRVSLALALVVSALCWSALQAVPLNPDQGAQNTALELAAQVGAAPVALAAQGDRVYISIGSRLTAWDATDLASITMVGSGPVLTDVARDISVQGGVAYARADRRMLAYDLAAPDEPRLIGDVELPAESHGSEYTDFEAVDLAAYYLKGSRLGIVDVLDPTEPRLAGELRLNGPLDGLAALGNVAFVGYEYGLLYAADVSDPDAPQEAGRADLPPFKRYSSGVQVRDVAAWGDHAYVVGGSLPTPQGTQPPTPIHSPTPTPEGWPTRPPPTPYTGEAYLRLVDVRDPAAMTETGALTVPHKVVIGESVMVASDRAYVVDDQQTLRIADVRDPHHPTELGTLDLNPSVQQTALVGGNVLSLYRSGWTGTPDRVGLQTVDTTDPTAPRVVADMDMSAWVLSGLAHDGATLYGADPQMGLRVVDISNPLEPRQVGAFDFPGAKGVALGRPNGGGATRAYLVDSTTLRLLDVTDRTNPFEIGSVQLSADRPSAQPPLSESFAVEGDHVFVLAGNAGLRIVDTTEPSDPREVASLPLPNEESPDHARVITVDGSYAYVGALMQTRDYRLHVVDVSDPERPVPVGALTVGWDLMALAARDGLVFATSYYSERGLHVVDAQDPTQPQVIGWAEAEPGLEELVLEGDLVYATKSDLRIYDASEPADPVELLVVDVPRAHVWVQYAEPLVVSETSVYLGDTGGTGLTVLTRQGDLPTPAPITPSATPSLTATPTDGTPVTPPGSWRCYIPATYNGEASGG